MAKKIDITGRLSPIFFVGCGLGSAGVPLLAGYVFTSFTGPDGILYLGLGMVLVQAVLATAMWLFSRKRRTGSEEATAFEMKE